MTVDETKNMLSTEQLLTAVQAAAELISCWGNPGSASLERWATFVREHPNDWQRPHATFISAHLKTRTRFYENLAKTGMAKSSIRRLRDEGNR